MKKKKKVLWFFQLICTCWIGSWVYRIVGLLLATSTLYYFRFFHWNLSRKFGFCRFQSRDAIIELVF
jgi:hypothetical protein